MPEVGILILDDDATNQHALKNILDSEGWRVRIVEKEKEALTELATGNWSLAIINTQPNVRGPLFAILKELSLSEAPDPRASDGLAKTGFRALFLVPAGNAAHIQPLLEREGLPYSLKPYHLNDFLEKVSELLVEAGAIAQPIRAIGGFTSAKKRRSELRSSRASRRSTMFASREDYQMTEEEMAEFERQEEEEKKKREKAIKDRGHL